MVGETPTVDSNLMKLLASYSFTSNRTVSTITSRLDNPTNTLYHNHLNWLKDLTSEMARNFAATTS